MKFHRDMTLKEPALHAVDIHISGSVVTANLNWINVEFSSCPLLIPKFMLRIQIKVSKTSKYHFVPSDAVKHPLLLKPQRTDEQTKNPIPSVVCICDLPSVHHGSVRHFWIVVSVVNLQGLHSRLGYEYNLLADAQKDCS